MKTKILLFAAVIGLTSIVGCKKYPDGPAFSFRSADSRLEQKWTPTKYIVDGDDQTAIATAAQYTITFAKGTATTTFIGGTISQTWAWGDSKKSIIITTPATVGGTASVETWIIKELKEKEFHITSTDASGEVTDITFKD